VDTILTYNEEELFSRIANGDESAFRVLFHHWQPLLASYIYKITESKEHTEEIIQDVFLKIWMARETLSEIHSFKHYLFVVGRNRSFDVMKKLLREEKLKKLAGYEMDKKDKTTEEEEFDVMASNLIDQAIDSLPPRRKEVYLLSRHERLTYQEIADRLNISKESVKTHLKLATDSISKFVRENMVSLLILIVESLSFKK
jgi:RNA polymerase sigma-70 factor (ECF subfamily)